MSDKNVVAPSLSELQTHHSEKWRAFPKEILPFPVAEMDFPVAQPIRDVLIEMVTHSDLGYLGNVPELGNSFAGFAKRRWNWSVDPSQVRAATDVGVAIVELIRVFMKPGEKILISSPVYHNFYTWINETKIEKVDVPFLDNSSEPDGSGWSINWPEIEKAYKTGIKIHLLCSPHNPLGKVYSKSDLIKIAELAKEHGVTVISDEIHAPLTYNETPFVPFLAVGKTAEEVGITVTSASKGWNIAGLKCAIIITQSEKMNEKLKELPVPVHYRTSLLGAFASAAAFESGEVWLDSVLENLDQNRTLIDTFITSNIPGIKYRKPQSTYLAWFNLEKLGLGEKPTDVILEKAKVALNPGSIYAPHTVQFARFNFATSPALITEALERIAQAL
jgi:cystathionine beta-lyase